MDQEILLNNALKAIENLFSDTSVPIETTLESLEEAQDNIAMKIECIEEDIRRKEKENNADI